MSKKARLMESLDSQLTQFTESLIRPTWCGSITPGDNTTTQCSDCQRGGFPKGWREWLCKESAKGGKEMISSSVILWHWWCLKFLVLILLKGKEKGKKNEGSNWYKGIGFHSFISNTLFGFMVLLPIDTKALGLIHPSIIFRLHLWFLFIVTS